MGSGRPKIVLAGAGGHAKVVAEIISASGGFSLVGATDAEPQGPAARGSGLKILGSDEILPGLLKKGIGHAAVGLGSVKDTSPRRRLRERLESLGFSLPPLVHPTAFVAPSAKVGAGAQVMARVVVNPGSVLAPGCVVNTAAVVEHDCRLGRDSFVGPGAVLGGDVEVGEGAFVGLGAVVLQGVKIGERAVVGAGAVVLEDVPAGETVFGVPARPRRAS